MNFDKTLIQGLCPRFLMFFRGLKKLIGIDFTYLLRSARHFSIDHQKNKNDT